MKETEVKTEDRGQSLPKTRIRPARPEDAAIVSEILAEAFPALYCWTFGRLSLYQTESLLHALYQAGTLTLTTARLAERDGNVVGVAILHIGEPIGRGTPGAFWRVTQTQLGFQRGLRAFVGGMFANFAISKRIPRGDDLVYVEALAVAAASRGQGVGARLLEDALEWTRARGRQRMALHVLQSNTGARRLYERMEFRLQSPEPRIPSPGSRRQAWVSLLMMRDL